MHPFSYRNDLEPPAFADDRILALPDDHGLLSLAGYEARFLDIAPAAAR